MAISPQAIEKISSSELSEADEQAVDRIEILIDDYLMNNYDPNYDVRYLMPEKLSVRAVHELLKRYR